MSIRVIQTQLNDRGGTVIVEADTQEEVLSSAARQAAINAATGVSRPGTSGGESPYPVDADGTTSDELMMGRGQVAAYRCDYKITGGL